MLVYGWVKYGFVQVWIIRLQLDSSYCQLYAKLQAEFYSLYK